MRQHLVDDTPVVETAMHIPGGDAVHRAYAVRDRGPTGEGADLLVVEIENRSAVPFALALVVGPFDPYAPVGEVAAAVGVVAGDRRGPGGSVLLVDGRPGLLLAKAPARAAAAVAGRRPGGRGGRRSGARLTLDPVSCPDGGARAGADLPAAPHRGAAGGAAARRAPTRSSVGGHRRRAGGSVSFPSTVPSAEQVAKGWEVQARRAMTVTLPDPRWTRGHRGQPGLPAARAPATLDSWVDAVDAIGALDRWGFHDEAGPAPGEAGDPRREPRPGRRGPLGGPGRPPGPDRRPRAWSRSWPRWWRWPSGGPIVPAGARGVRPAGLATVRRPAASSGGPGPGRGGGAARGHRPARRGSAVGQRAQRLESTRRTAPATVEPGPVPHPGWPAALSPADTLRQAARGAGRGLRRPGGPTSAPSPGWPGPCR